MTQKSAVPAVTSSRELAHLGGNRMPSEDRLDLTESFSFFRRHALLILATTAAIMAIVLVASMLMPKTYRARSAVMLTNDASAAGQTATTQNSQAAISNQLVETQSEVIESRDMADRVVTALGIGDKLSPSDRDDLLSDIQRRVSAQRSGESYALSISYDASSPGDAVRMANAFATQFTQWQLHADQDRNDQARRETEVQLSALRAQAQKDTEALQQYRVANNLLSTSGSSLTEQEISNFNQQVAAAKASAAEDQARLNTALAQLRSGSNGDDVGEALGSQVISNLRTQESELAGQVANMASRYGPNHPELIRTRSQLDQVREQIQAEIGRVVSNLKAKADVSNQRLGSLSASLGGAKTKLTQNNVAMVGLSELERNSEASQAIYETYLNSYKQLLAARGSERPSAVILTLASLPKNPISPNLKLNLALAAVIGLGLGILGAYVAEAMFQGLTTPEEIENLTGEQFLTSIPLLSSINSNHVGAMAAVRDEPFSIFTEAFRSLGTSVDMATNGGAQVVAVTSALPGEGKTVISCCLSHIYATSGLKTILIDCDLRRHGISRLLNIDEKQSGLIEVLEGNAKLNFTSLHSDDYVFWTLPLLPGSEDAEHLLSGPEFTALLDKLRTQFDRIVLDLPPVLPVAYTRTLASRADATIIAAHWRKTSAFALKAALRRLPEDHVRIAGIALNQVDLRRRAYFGRYDPAYYYKQYSEYYA
ncbi:Wzz/FepE/Etk N-terminal domain-containing protein [Novosphingobium sp.]|uniref:GumC family protein n=1 Tax=Novosphingobium sp. TaxID=1874826 RepID=UPI0025CCDA13|nr:Wzz/FepE/Etk N-terminal domain-containing protein [Novosphingobium sp.]